MSKYWKIPILNHISDNSHTRGSDALTFVGSVSSLEVTLTECHNLVCSGFPFQKSGGVQQFPVPTFKDFQFRPRLSFDKF